MLAKKTYPQAYIRACRDRVEADVEAFGTVRHAATPAFEHRFFAALLLALDRMFVHRLRSQEGKDGNPLNELRVLCDALLEHDGILVVPATIKLQAATSVLSLEPGAAVALSEDAFLALSGAVFGELEARFQA